MNAAELARQTAGEVLPVEDLVARLAPALVPVPERGEAVCPRCRSDKSVGFDMCRACSDNEGRLEGGGVDVIPISMSEHMGRLHDHLRQYKDAVDGCVRYRMATALGGLLVTFLRNHGTCLGEWDVVSTVPSTNREGMHPLHQLIARIHRLRDGLRSPLVANPRYTGAPRVASPIRFLVPDPDVVRGQRVLLVDDTFTSGGSIQSAAYALHEAGAVVSALVLGRHVNSTQWPPGKELLDRLAGRTWSEERCAICGPPVISPPTLL